ncbi:uncharacterized protein LOC129581910 [Paramacrobiotus metropolitanus]|uniref:uncharacterized protein LOC129581910 n=1 Tax=Paramacrobiotus metropolitanus TaxID=2943436 RepID=UPI002445A717|nr:uncharacterized protein LOC129581910 [Paramacrobiotus metropolitanus]
MLDVRIWHFLTMYSEKSVLCIVLVLHLCAIQLLSGEPANCVLVDQTDANIAKIILVCRGPTRDLQLFANEAKFNDSLCVIRESVLRGYWDLHEKIYECATYYPGQYACKCGRDTSNTINKAYVLGPTGSATSVTNSNMGVGFTDALGETTFPKNVTSEPLPSSYISYASDNFLYIVGGVFGAMMLLVPTMWFVMRRRMRKHHYTGVTVHDGNVKVQANGNKS